jgi:single-strand DNA-binding protein
VACGGAQSPSMGCPRPVSVVDTGNYAGNAGVDSPNYRGQVKLPADKVVPFSMAKSVNKVILLGNVGKDPEIRATANGMTVANFSIATTDRIKGQDGQYTDKTEWHNLVAFQRTAEIVRDYVKKGNKLYVEGRLQTSSWDDKASGQKKYRTEIIVSDLSLLSGRGEGGESGGGYSRSSTASYGSAPVSQPDYADQGITDDDIPF